MDSSLIKEPILKYLNKVELLLNDEIPTDIKISFDVIKHLINKPGKRLRPSIVLLSALSLGKIIDKKILSAAASVELLHNASLIHDDIVDQAEIRRGLKSANKIWGDHATVLVGDFLLARSLFLINKSKNSQVMGSVTNAASELANGQILDIMISKRLVNFNQDIYFKMIRLKTASLISSSAEVGALLSTSDISKVRKLKSYGINLGISYQLIDDALDLLGDTRKMGKNTMEDIKEGKVTLPMLIALDKAPSKDKRGILKILQKKNFDRKNLDILYNFVLENNAVEETLKSASDYSSKAIVAIESLNKSQYKDSLIALAKENIVRVS
ncbi:polyprenyl synthetase family protein [bacterium]|jgi:octaprenyl-diphosphate synthase|nr:polyprenyl synthetase family protein [bacterium]MBT3794966.1 polyprenyl synthetase family protein [bacterium]MBT4634918.1 polyprenyl synthetase family protein [bacterium]